MAEAFSHSAFSSGFFCVVATVFGFGLAAAGDLAVVFDEAVFFGFAVCANIGKKASPNSVTNVKNLIKTRRCSPNNITKLPFHPVSRILAL